MGSLFLSLAGLIIAIIMIMVFAYRGVNVLLLAPLAGLIIMLTSGYSVSEYMSAYSSGFGGQVAGTVFLYSASMVMAALMQKAGYLHSIAYFIADTLGLKHIAIICMISVTIFTIGGMSSAGWVVMYQIGLILCQKANIHRGFLAGAVMCPCWTFAATMPFAASLPNGLISPVFGTDNSAGMVIGVVSAILVAVINAIYLERLQYRGGEFRAHELVGAEVDRAALPSPLKSVLPFVLVLILYNVFKMPVATAVYVSAIYVTIVEFKNFKMDFWRYWQSGFKDAITPIVAVSAMGGIGAVLRVTPAWDALMNFISTAKLNPYVLVFVFVALVGACLGSGSATVTTSLIGIQEMLPTLIATGAELGNLHRLIAIAAHGTSALPYSGGILGCLEIYRTDHKESYGPIFVTCSLVPFLVGVAVALPMCLLGL